MAQTTSQQKFNEIALVSQYKLGYRNREDVTNLPQGVLITGSQNVLTNVSERVQIRQGYALDGATSSIASAILASFDWVTRGNGERNLRAGFLTIAGNDGKLQFRYVNPTTLAVTWVDLMTGLTSVNFNFTQFWDTSEALRVCLFVNGASEINEWNGAYTELLSATATTITKAGDTWADSGFYVNGNKKVIINGTEYTYTGGESTNTLTGVTPNPTGEAIGSIIFQKVVTTSNASMTGITSTFKNGLISVMNNQIFLGSLTSSVMWLSKVNDYKDYSSSTTRQIGEGGSLILDQNLVGFVVQGNETAATMYVSAVKDIWYKITFNTLVSVVGASGEIIGAVPIKSGKRQGAISQALISNMKNNVIAVSNEPTVDIIGLMENYYTTIQTQNISDPIKLDIDSYDFTDGSIFYFKYFIYVAVPKEGVIRIYNLITASWEAPQTIPVSRFYIVNGELYGHSYLTSESYKLFVGYADRAYPGFVGSPIVANWVFSFQHFGVRPKLKSANYLYVEGYINPNTIATAKITYELDGCQTIKTFKIDGSDSQIVCLYSSNASLGKESLGKHHLGGGGNFSIQNLPPKFRVYKSFQNKDFFECSISFSVVGINDRFELLAFGLNAVSSTQEPVSIRQ